MVKNWSSSLGPPNPSQPQPLSPKPTLGSIRGTSFSQPALFMKCASCASEEPPFPKRTEPCFRPRNRKTMWVPAWELPFHVLSLFRKRQTLLPRNSHAHFPTCSSTIGTLKSSFRHATSSAYLRYGLTPTPSEPMVTQQIHVATHV